MGDPTTTRQAFGSMGRRTVAEERQRADELLARIEAERLVSGWVWKAMTDTLGRLSELPDDLAWVASAYLAAVAVRGDRMFYNSPHQPQLGEAADVRATIRCRCGAQAPADQPVQRNHREVVVALCDECGLVQAMYDGEPYSRPTLISAAHV